MKHLNLKIKIEQIINVHQIIMNKMNFAIKIVIDYFKQILEKIVVINYLLLLLEIYLQSIIMIKINTNLVRTILILLEITKVVTLRVV